MKKIVTLGAIAAVAGGMMFAQPVFEPSVTLDGSATAKWGVDLDAGQTGFQNDTSGDFKVKLWGDGSRELEEGDGIWAELKVTGKETTINKGKLEGGDWELNEAKLHFGPVYLGVKSGDTQVGEYKFDGAIRSADNDNAKWLSNVGPDKFSQGIVVGFANDSFDIGVDLRSYYDEGAKAEYEFDTATGKAKEKTKAADGTNTKYTSAYAIAAEAKIKDSNTFLPGLSLDVGVGYNLSDHYATQDEVKVKDEDGNEKVVAHRVNSTHYFGSKAIDNFGDALKAAALEDAFAESISGLSLTDAEIAAAKKAFLKAAAETEAELADSEIPGVVAIKTLKKGIEDSVAYKNAKKDLEDAEKAFAANPNATTFGDIEAAKLVLKPMQDEIDAYDALIASKKDAAAKAAAEAAAAPAGKREDETKVHTLGYAFNASYKLKIDDKFYVKPAVGLTGTNVSIKGNNYSASSNSNNLVAGLLFGWGDTADSDAGVYFLNDGDQTKKVTPGISVVAAIPFASTVKVTDDGHSYSGKSVDKVKAIIVPSVYLGSDLVPNLKFAAYSEMAILGYEDKCYNESGDNFTAYSNAANKDRTFALALAAGVAYDLKIGDDFTITPKAGVRFANTAYNENKINSISPLSNKPLFEAGFGKMGEFGQGKATDSNNQNYLNLKAGVDINAIANTTFFVEYSSGNLLANGETKKAEYDEDMKYYNAGAGTLDVGVKISF